ncbi:MAG: pyridoxamine 5'-phosphate oxidase [Methylacidiphilales bacterium]|nr:pyridoxamine 5'-phosphate oxidase [Candidatus Methylacidiphilales bacterium]
MPDDRPSPADIAALRRDYMRRGLDQADLDPDPFHQFGAWLKEALETKAILEPNAMVLSTVSPSGQPSGRYVLLKGFDSSGFVFFTNYQSAKARDFDANPRAALTIGWIELERQVNIHGSVKKTPRSAVEAYFASRPRGSRLGAWASHQSKVIPNRDILEARLAEANARFPGDVPPPPEWGGFCLVPERIEFWQGRSNRLHDRLLYRKEGSSWIIERLSP